MLGEEIGQTLILFETFHSDEIMMLSELDPEMLFEDIRTGLAQHWKPSEKWWKIDKEQKALLELMNSITRKGLFSIQPYIGFKMSYFKMR